MTKQGVHKYKRAPLLMQPNLTLAIDSPPAQKNRRLLVVAEAMRVIFLCEWKHSSRALVRRVGQEETRYCLVIVHQPWRMQSR